MISYYESIHVYFYPETYIRTLFKLIPVFEFLNGAKQKYFFVNYVDQRGPHIRLRLQNPDSLLLESVKKYIRTKLSIDPFLTPFKPEVDRYGGKMFYLYIYEYYCESSLYLINQLLKEPYLFERLKYFNFIAYCIESIFNHDRNEFSKIFTSLYFAWSKSLGEEQAHLPSFDEDINKIVKKFASACFIQNISLEEPTKSILDIIPEDYFRVRDKGDIVHLTANRFGLSNQEEVMIYKIFINMIKDENK